MEQIPWKHVNSVAAVKFRSWAWKSVACRKLWAVLMSY